MHVSLFMGTRAKPFPVLTALKLANKSNNPRTHKLPLPATTKSPLGEPGNCPDHSHSKHFLQQKLRFSPIHSIVGSPTIALFGPSSQTGVNQALQSALTMARIDQLLQYIYITPTLPP